MHLNLTCFVSMQQISIQIEDFYSGNKGFFIGKLYTPGGFYTNDLHPFLWEKEFSFGLRAH